MNKLYPSLLNFLGKYAVLLSKFDSFFFCGSSISYFKEKKLSKLPAKTTSFYENPTMVGMLAFDLRQTLFGAHTNNPLATQDDYFLADFISDIVPNIYVIAGLIVFIYFVIGGFMVITSAGNAESTQKGQKALTNAIIGFVVIITSYWLIQIIETITGVVIFG